MFKKLFFVIFLLVSQWLLAQKEANIWYFGEHAGLDFNSGNPVALTNGQLATEEGCATISNKDGQLLFYTDGSTVWNRNHNIMLNGTGLKGHYSSTNSAIIVPKPDAPNIYYIFTIDAQAGDNGLQYSEVDMSLDGGMGGVTSSKNNFLFAPTTEQITAIKNPVKNAYWVVSHKWENNEFLAYEVTSSGVNTTPVISALGGTVNGNFLGVMKISPNGRKLAMATKANTRLALCDFNPVTGQVSNYMNLQIIAYGLEFSPNSKLLYACDIYGARVLSQFNLESNNETDIYNSRVIISNGVTSHLFGAMQLASDGKIYVSRNGKEYMDVINNPNGVGLSCDYELEAVYLEGRLSKLGLPPFIQSFFKLESILVSNTCYGDHTTFELQDVVDAVVWDFGDPASGVNNTSTDFEPTHIFSSSGTYEVTLTASIGAESVTESVFVTIKGLPNINGQVTLKQCDNDLDGFSMFNLNEVIPKITGNAMHETITFFESQLNAETNNNSIMNVTAYINKTVSSDTVWARVENGDGCFRVSQVDLIVTTTQIPDTYVRDFYVCDEDSDGISIFDFSSVNQEILNMFPSGQQLVIAYYRNEADALSETNAIVDITNYSNNDYPHSQQVYVRVDSELDNDCLGLGAHINLFVEPKPMANPVTIDRQCDDDSDGMFPFDVSQIESKVLNGQLLTDVSVSYFDENNNLLPSPLPNPFLTSCQTITIRVTNNNVGDGSCYAETVLEFIVDAQPVANSVPNQIACDDGMDDSDGIHDFDTASIESIVLNGQTGMEVHYFTESGMELPSPLPNPFATPSQTIEVRVINPMNTVCYATTSFDFIVNPLPEFSIETPQIVCSSDPTFTVVLDPLEENPMEVFDYEWRYENGSVLSNDPTLTVSIPGTYFITLTKTDGTGCSRTREIFVNASELATITQEDITVIDISNNNSITINTTNLGQGDYEFSLDSEFSNYQDAPFFENVKPGIHVLYVRDKKGCGISALKISVIGYPKYFTPNGDGFNDYWNIKGVDGQFQPNTNIFIYDRYGKLLRQFIATSIGWDGTFNGRLLPSDDYWFSVTLEDGRLFKGHFALKQ